VFEDGSWETLSRQKAGELVPIGKADYILPPPDDDQMDRRVIEASLSTIGRFKEEQAALI
jgi:hypothetical protein